MGVLAKPVPFGDYFLLEKINTGGMAEVFKAKSFGVEGFERMLAVKRILPSIAEDKEFISMFIDEAKIAVQLTHANVAQIFDLGCIDDQYYIAMEYVPGRDARVIFDRAAKSGEQLAIDCVCHIVSRICEGLDYAHNKCNANGEPLDIVHRDISPQNILISYDGECKLIDFGIAKAQSKSSATQVGILKGKFSYMSPEQIKGGKIDRRSDIFALGIVLFELLTLKRLFLGSSDFSTLEKIRKVEVSPPTLYNPNIPDELEDIVLKALEKDPAMRFQTAHEMQEALQKFMFHQNMYYSAKELSAFMHHLFSNDILREKKKNELYKDLTKDVLEKSRDEDGVSAGRKSVASSAAVSGKSGKGAIYDALDDFMPSDDDVVVYSDKAKLRPAADPQPQNPVDAPVTLDHAPRPRKSIQLDVPRSPTVTTSTVASKLPATSGSSKVLPIVTLILTLSTILVVVWFFARSPSEGSVIFEIDPEGVLVEIEIDNETKSVQPSPIAIERLSARGEHTYKISAPDYETAKGTFTVTKGAKETYNIALNPKSLNLEIYVTPSFATVYVDDKKLEPSEKLFKVSNVQKGNRKVVVKLDKYKEYQQIVNITGTDNPQKLEVQLQPAFGGLRLETEPINKEYIITDLSTGDVKRGYTNATVPELNVDNAFRIQIMGCARGNSQNVDLSDWRPKSDGGLSILNFRCEGDSGIAVPPPPPQQPVVTAPAPTERPVQQARPTTPKTPRPQTTAEPKPAAKQEAPAKQEKAEAPKPAAKPAPAGGPGFLLINSKPPTNVIINGKDYGKTPKKVELPAGTYKVRFKNDDAGIDSTMDATVKTGEAVKITRK